jgi:hypothetical protein
MTIKYVKGDNYSLVAQNNYIKQIIQNHVIDAYTYAGGGTRVSMRELTCLNTTIITSQTNSKISIDMSISMETIHNTVFVLYRVISGVETEIGSPASAGDRAYGFSVMIYDNNVDSTMSPVIIQYVDSPMVAKDTPITYKLKCYGDSGYGYFINRTLLDDNTAIYERVTSNVRLTEFGGDDQIINVSWYNGTNSMSMGYMYVRDEQVSGYAGGGSSVAATWTTRRLNTVKTNTISNASLDSVNYLITLPAGTYRVRAKCPAYICNDNRAKLYNYTTSADILIGSTAYSNNSYYVQDDSIVEGQFTLSSASQICLKHWALSSISNYGFGRSATTGDNEVFAEIEIWEVPELLPLVPMASETGFASQAEALAGFSNLKMLSPQSLRQSLSASGSAPIYACRAWVNFDGTGTVAIRGSGNVSSITDNGTGDYIVNFITPMEDVNYSVVSSNTRSDGAQPDIGGIRTTVNPITVSNFNYFTKSDSGVISDMLYCCIAVFR